MDDGSPDASGAMCDAWAAKDDRVTVIHQDDGGVSAPATRVGAADSEFMVFLDSDDALRPGALQAALDAQSAAPEDFVLWHYTTDGRRSRRRNGRRPAPPGRPWHGFGWTACLLCRGTNCTVPIGLNSCLLTQSTHWARICSLYWIILHCWRQKAPGFGYRVLKSPLTFYDCSRRRTLSTQYHANYCEIWPEHFAKLNAACLAAQCPVEDMRQLHRAELTVFAEGVADILRRDPAPLSGVRGDKAATALRSPWLRALLDCMRTERCYSAYYLPCRWRSTRLVYPWPKPSVPGRPLYGKLDWAGYYLLGGRLRTTGI